MLRGVVLLADVLVEVLPVEEGVSHLHMAFDRGGGELAELLADRVRTLELVAVGGHEARVVAARIDEDARRRVAVDVAVLGVERERVRLAREERRLLGARRRELGRRAQRSHLRDRRVELLLGGLPAGGARLAGLVVHRGVLERLVSLLLVALDHRADRLRKGLGDGVRAL